VRSIAPPSSWTWLVPEKICAAKAIACPSGRCLADELQLVADQSHAKTVERFIAGLSDEAYDAVPNANDVTSKGHGFFSNSNIGYYYFYQPLAFEPARDARAMFIVLDSEDLEEQAGGTSGHLGAAQTKWLENLVACERAHPQDLMFVMAHQPIADIKLAEAGKSLASILDASPNMVGYLYGHYHTHAICAPQNGRQSCSKFWEIETGSLIEFPQEARMIRIKQISENVGFLELFTFRENLLDTTSAFGQLVELGRRGAERDHCRSHPGFPCSDDLRPYRMDGRESNARLFFRFPKLKEGEKAPISSEACERVEELRGTQALPLAPEHPPGR
jgi:hypothetical protein